MVEREELAEEAMKAGRVFFFLKIQWKNWVVVLPSGKLT